MRTFDELLDDLQHRARWAPDEAADSAKKALRTMLADAVAAERERFPSLLPVIQWLENGCDSKEAAKELRIYQQMMSGPNVIANRPGKARDDR